MSEYHVIPSLRISLHSYEALRRCIKATYTVGHKKSHFIFNYNGHFFLVDFYNFARFLWPMVYVPQKSKIHRKDRRDSLKLVYIE